MSNVEISESYHLKPQQFTEDNEIGEIYEDKGYSKIPLDQINLNTEPISISTDFSYSLFDNNIKSYIKVFLGFVVFIIMLIIISILSGHFHYEKIEIENENLNNKIVVKREIELNKTSIQSYSNQTISENITKNISIDNNITITN